MERYVLKHFYYGQFVKNGKPVGDMRLLAKTNGISDAAVAEVLQLALIPPLKRVRGGSWAVIRGKSDVPFVLVRSNIGEAGQSVLHFALLPSELLRAMGGNLRLFKPFLGAPVPSHERVGLMVDPIVLSNVQPPAEDDEINDILDLMTYTQNRMTVMETLLGAVVQGLTVLIVNAPEDTEQRFTFVAGLIALLPPSVRFAVTFATHTTPKTKIEAQIKFVTSTENAPENAVIYDWVQGELGGANVRESYSRFIVSQLRLDAELVIQQTRSLTGVASWRVKQGDKLAEALAYASQRMSMDDAVRNGQPVEVQEVARMLAKDPTLSDDLRAAYARHLMSFSVALGELKHAEPLGIILRKNADLAMTAHNSLRESIDQGAARDTYVLLKRWLANPLGPQGQSWIDLAGVAATTYFDELAQMGNTREMRLFLRDVNEAGVAVGAEYLVPKLIEMAKPLAPLDDNLAKMLFVYGCQHMTVDRLAELLRGNEILTQLPEGLRSYVRAIQSSLPNTRPGLLAKATLEFKSSRRLILMRLVELALFLKHGDDVIDEKIPKQLILIAREDWSKSYYPTIAEVVRLLSDEEHLRKMSEGGQRSLLGALLAIGYYKELAKQMKRQSSLLYSVDNQMAYAQMVQQLFAEARLPDEQIPLALETIVNEGIRSVPMVMAFVGVLQSRKEPSEATDAVAGDLVDALEADAGIVQVLPVDAIRVLIAYHMRRRNVDSILSCARILADVCARYGEKTAKIVAETYRRMASPAPLAAYRVEMLRRYIRMMHVDSAPAAIGALAPNIDDEVMEKIRATYAIKAIAGDRYIEDFAQALHKTATFLEDTAEAYASRNTPTQGALLNDLDSMPGGLNSEEKEQIAEDVIATGKLICEIAEQHKQVRNSGSDRRIDDLLAAKQNPESPLEVLRVLGGFLSQGKRISLKLASQEHPHPLPSRGGPTLLQELATVRSILSMFDNANGTFEASALWEEFDILWKQLPSDHRREIEKDLMSDLQRVAELIPHIADKGDLRALEDTGLGRRLESQRVRPRNALEFYRFMAGYYLARA